MELLTSYLRAEWAAKHSPVVAKADSSASAANNLAKAPASNFVLSIWHHAASVSIEYCSSASAAVEKGLSFFL